MTPDEARQYITYFSKHVLPGTTFVEFADGSKVTFSDMTDEDAIRTANGLGAMEAEAAERSLRKGRSS